MGVGGPLCDRAAATVAVEAAVTVVVAMAVPDGRWRWR